MSEFQKLVDDLAESLKIETDADNWATLKDVIVIGCGASGIAALALLTEAGLDVCGLEAANRIGGRINTTEFADGLVDLGAAWCHGEKDNRVYELAAGHDLLAPPKDKEDEWYIYSDGTLMPTGNAQFVLNRINLENIGNYDLKNENDDPMSISEYIRDQLEPKVHWSTTVKPRQIPLNESLIEWYERNMHSGGQIDPRTKKSLKGLAELKSCSGEFWLNWKGQGYRTILDVILHKPPYSDNPIEPEIKLNKKVTNINWNNVTVDNQPCVVVKCEDGSEFIANIVVVTVSLGVLKARHEKLFTPALPPDHVKAINNLEFCVLDKIYIEFASQWWPKDPANFMILWKEEDKETFADISWVTGIYGLRTVETHSKVLLAWIYGEGAKKMEAETETAVRAGVQKFFDHVFSVNFKVSEIVSIKRSQWAINEFVRGSYSYRSVYTEINEASAKTLSKPIDYKEKSVVYFAGEATSVHHHNSVHGAIETGEIVANKLIRRLQPKMITNLVSGNSTNNDNSRDLE